MSRNTPVYTHMEALAELRKRLWLDKSVELSAESRRLYTHIEKTLITTLGEHYGKQNEKNRQSDRDNIKKS